MEIAKNILVTGGAGFIGSSFLRHLASKNVRLVILDALTYAGHLRNLPNTKHHLIIGNICNHDANLRILQKYQIDSIINFAAESHVDNSIIGPGQFIATNILGTYSLLGAALSYYKNLEASRQQSFRFLQVSTDEVFGSLQVNDHKFNEQSNIQPNSPYSASKAAADLLVRAWYETYKLPVIITHTGNNFGPRQYPEKLIPVIITNALSNQPIPVYGHGNNIRDWIFVDDHSYGIYLALTKGKIGEKYCFSGGNEVSNLELVKLICGILDNKVPRKDGSKYFSLVKFVDDRPGHDFRYAIDDQKARQELGFKCKHNLIDALGLTVDWYLENQDWFKTITQLVKADNLKVGAL